MCTEEVDIIGYSSCGFRYDVDDQNSIDSTLSDSGADAAVAQEVSQAVIHCL